MNITQHQGAVYAVDAPIIDEVRRLSYLDLDAIRDEVEGDWSRSSRAHIRYMAALWPDQPLPQLAATIAGVIGNRSLSVQDTRLILQGRSLSDPSRTVDTVRLEQIQSVGVVLRRGGTKAEASRASGLSPETVHAIDGLLGLTQRRQDAMVDSAVVGLREGWTVRRLAGHLGVSKSTAHRLLQQAHAILVELGEVK